jgi:hypothetical protein
MSNTVVDDICGHCCVQRHAVEPNAARADAVTTVAARRREIPAHFSAS